jgi:hypothetical protein
MSEATAAAAPAAETSAATPTEGASHATDTTPSSPAAEQARKWKLQVGGAEQELDDAGLIETLIGDLGEDGVKSAAQIAKAARERMRSASEHEKKLRAMAADLKDPKKLRRVLDHIYGENGGSRALAEEWIAGELEEAKVPEAERKLRQRERELAEREARIKAAEEREKQERQRSETQRAQQAIGQRFSKSLEAAGLKPTEYTIARMAALAEADLDAGIPIDPDDLARQVARDYREGDIGSMLKALPPDELAKLLGDEKLRSFRQWDVERVRAKQRPAAAPAAPASIGRRREERRGVHVDDFFASLKK